MPRPPHPSRKVDPAALDWTLPDAELARRVGLSRQRVGALRRDFAAGRPSPVRGRHWVSLARDAQLAALKGDILRYRLSVRETAAALGVWERSMSAVAARCGVEFARGQIPMAEINWDLPSHEIERIWRLPHNRAATIRSTTVRRPPRWRHGQPRADLAEAVRAEEQKAAAWFAAGLDVLERLRRISPAFSNKPA